MLVTLEEVKTYLRVSSHDEDALIENLMESSEKLCQDVAKLDEESFLKESAKVRIAILYTIAYLFEHREEADYRELMRMIRCLLFGVRREVF